jgi:acyl transferase domain-containing protein
MKTDKQACGKIAIVGMSGRFPGAPDMESFWRLLCDGQTALRQYTTEEIRAGIDAHDYLTVPFIERQVASGTWVGAGYFLADVDKFDAGFFGYSPNEAELIDPQQRIFLEAAWSAMEDAGCIPDDYRGAGAVFAGTGLSRYFLNNVYANRNIMLASDRDLIAGIGNEPDYLTNRVAYKLNLTGPSVTVQTACSTSLVAIHMACQALRAGECDLSLAGGSMVIVPNGLGYQYQEGSMNSSDGLIRAFDADAKGTVFGEGGVGVIVLKRLEDALADNDNIYAVIRGSAVTNDGSHKAGYTAPGIDGQVDAIARALAASGTHPDDITYVEAHGTGTLIGDPIEVAALTRAFRQQTSRNAYCAIGSVKTNIGHLAPAAGVASVMKAALAARYGMLPPSLHYDRPNPRIDFANSPFYVNDQLREWNVPHGGKRIASVSSFGIGGTNAHLILEEPPQAEATASADKLRIFALSAKTPGALSRAATQLAQFLDRHPASDLDDVAFTLQEGRRAFDVRAAVACTTLAQLVESLQRLASNPPKTGRLSPDRKMALMFTGQGSQYAGMARELHAALPEFRDIFDECCRQLAPQLEVDLSALLLAGADADLEAANAILRETRYAQPALFVVEYALACQLVAWQMQPDAMLGHSLGEYVAATLAGVFAVEDALQLVALRGRLMQAMEPGAMLAIASDEATVSGWLGAGIELAAVNSARACVVSGTVAAIDALAVRLESEGVNCRRLQTSHAFHSIMMQPLADEFRAAVAAAAPQEPVVPIISNVTGTWMTPEQACDPDYWVQHLLSPVRFQAGIETLLGDGYGFLAEAGPSGVLCTFVRHMLGNGSGKAAAVAIPLMRHPQDGEAGDRFLSQAVGDLWAAGYALDFAEIDVENVGCRISLPTYPFARERHWLEAPPAPDHAEGDIGLRRSADLGAWFHAASWRRQPWLEAVPVLAGRRVLVVDDENAFSTALCAALLQAGAVVLRAVSGSDFADLGHGAFGVRAAEVADWERLAQRAGRPDLIVHAWLLETSGGAKLDNASATLERGFHTLLALAQAYGDEASATRIPLLTVASELFDVQSGETLDAVKATALGAHLSIGHEYRRLISRALDLPFSVIDNPAHCVRLVLDELARLEAEPHAPLVLADKFVAYRNGARWLSHVEAMNLTEPAVPLTLAADGAYLITGGLGGLGLEFAEALVERGARQLALIGRSSLPPQAQWTEWLAVHPDDATGAQRIRRLQRLIARGVEIAVEACDVAKPQDVTRMVDRVLSRFATIRGAVHAAGVAGAGMMALKTRAQADAVLAPKVFGALALERALENQPLDFFVLVSSLFATIGGVGQVDYSAANNFLDAFARSRSARGARTLSLAFGGWREVGMAVATGHTASAAAPALPEGRNVDHPYLFNRQDADGELRFVAHLRACDHWALQEHRINGIPVMPGTGLIEMVRAAWREVSGVDVCALTGLFFYRPLFVPSDSMVTVTVALRATKGGSYDVEVRSADGPVLSADLAALTGVGGVVDLAAIAAACADETLDFGEGQAALVGDAGFLVLGANWQVVRRIHLGAQQLLGELTLPPALQGELQHFMLHPALLDMATGPITGHLLLRLDLGLDAEYLPFTYGRLQVFDRLTPSLHTHVRYRGISDDRDTIHFDISLHAPDGSTLVAIEDFRLRKVPANAFAAKASPLVAALDDGSISPQEGRQLFLRALSVKGDCGHWIINPHSLDAMLRRMRAERIAEATRVTAKKAKMVREDVITAPPTNPTEAVLVTAIEEALGMTPVGIHDNFFDLGIDSVIGIQVVSQAKKHGVLIKPNQLFEHQTVAELAAVAIALEASVAALAPSVAGVADKEGDMQFAELNAGDLDAVLEALGQSK